MDRVGVQFDGNAVGAIGAARGTATAIREVRSAAGQTSPSLRNLESDFGRVERGALAGTGALHGMGRAALYLGSTYIGAFGVGAALKAASDELVTQVRLGAQTQAVLRSTGGIAGVTAAMINKLADAEERKTGVDHNQIKAAELMLLRYTNVRDVAGQGNDIFARATRTALNLSVALGVDVASSATQLGKALNDPVRGLTLLRREGASFTADEVKQIQTLARHGELLQAQKKILDALARSYGGTAAAVGKVEPWNQAKNALQRLSADALRPMLPELDQAATKVGAWADKVEHNRAEQQKLKDDIDGVIGTAKSFVSTANDVAGALGGWTGVVEGLVALRLAPKIYEWSGAMTTLIGSESAGALAGLAGAEFKSEGLLRSLVKLKNLGPIVVTVALEFIPHAKPSSNPNAPSNNPFLKRLGGLPVVGGLFSQANRLSDYLNQVLGITPAAGSPGALGGLVTSPTSGVTGGKSLATTAAVRAAVAPFMNIPYQWGGGHAYTPGPSFASGHGRSGLGLDCSGFARAALANLGVTVSGTADTLLHEAKTHPSVSELQPGDLIFYEGVHPNHVMVYLGGGRVIGETHTGASGPEIKPVNYLKITGTGRYLPSAKGGAGVGGGALPPRGGSTTTGASANALPAPIRLAVAAAGAAAAQAALTPGKRDDKAAVAQQRAAVEDEIRWLRAKLKTNIGSEKRITFEDLLTGALGDLSGLGSSKTKAGAASIGVVTSLRNTVAQDLKGLPGTLDDVEQNAVAHLKELRNKLKVGMSAKDLADTRAGIQNWGKVLKSEISKQAKVARDAANAAAALWQRGWQNDVNRVLRDFQENVVDKQLSDFDRETQQGLAAIQARYATQTPEEKALADFRANRSATAEAKQKSDLQAQIADVQSQLAGLGQTATDTATQVSDTVNGTLIDIATGTRTALTQAADAAGGTGSSTDIVSQRADLLKQLADLQDQYQQLELDDQEAALQTAADQSREAANTKEQADESTYQSQRDAQRQALQDQLDDQATALQQNLDDWQAWLEAKKKSWSDFLEWLRDNGISTVLDNPGASGGSSSPASTIYNIPQPGKAIPFATGGRIPGVFIGRDSVPILASPGERMLDRRVNALIEELAMRDGAGGPTVAIFKLGERQIAQAVAEPMTAEQARQIGYTIQRG